MTGNKTMVAAFRPDRADRPERRFRCMAACLLIALGLLGLPPAHGAEGVVDKIPTEKTAPRCVGSEPPDRCVVLGKPVECQDFGPLDPYAIWADVGSSRRVEAFLVAEHEKLGRDVARFARWLACQGFEVTVWDREKLRKLSDGEHQIDAGFLIENKKKLFYYDLFFLTPHAHYLEIEFSNSNQISEIKISATTK